MNLWVSHPQEMANAKRRRAAVTKALIEHGVIINQELIARAGAESVDIPYRNRTIKVRCLTIRGLEQIAKHLGIEVPK